MNSELSYDLFSPRCLYPLAYRTWFFLIWQQFILKKLKHGRIGEVLHSLCTGNPATPGSWSFLWWRNAKHVSFPLRVADQAAHVAHCPKQQVLTVFSKEPDRKWKEETAPTPASHLPQSKLSTGLAWGPQAWLMDPLVSHHWYFECLGCYCFLVGHVDTIVLW